MDGARWKLKAETYTARNPPRECVHSEGDACRAPGSRAAADTASIHQLPVVGLAVFCCTMHHSAACGLVAAERLIFRDRKQKLEQKHIRGVPVAQKKGECKFDLSSSSRTLGRPLTPQRKGREGLSAASSPAGSLKRAGLGATMGRWEVGIF